MGFITGIYCDQCEKQMCFSGCISKTILTSIARDKGWKIGKQCRCPECATKKGSDRNGSHQ